MPASSGTRGPGDITTRAGFDRAMSATDSVSLRSTVTVAPSSRRYCTRLKVNEL